MQIYIINKKYICKSFNNLQKGISKVGKNKQFNTVRTIIKTCNDKAKLRNEKAKLRNEPKYLYL